MEQIKTYKFIGKTDKYNIPRGATVKLLKTYLRRKCLVEYDGVKVLTFTTLLRKILYESYKGRLKMRADEALEQSKNGRIYLNGQFAYLSDGCLVWNSEIRLRVRFDDIMSDQWQPFKTRGIELKRRLK